MENHNMTTGELIYLADLTENKLAQDIAARIEAERVSVAEDKADLFKEAYLELLGTQIDEVVEAWAKDFEKDGHEYVSYAEGYDHAVAEECSTWGNVSRFTDYLDRVLTDEHHDYSTPEMTRTTTYHISKEAFELYCAFSDDQVKDLMSRAGGDISASFNDELIHQFTDCRNYFYSATFGESENQVESIDVFESIPTDSDGDRVVTDDEINGVMGSGYFSGGSLYLDMTDMGIAWAIDLDWLESAILEIAEEASQAD